MTFCGEMTFVLSSPIISHTGEMKRREAYENDQRTGSRYVSTLVIAAAIIAAVRLAREDVGRGAFREAAD